MLETTVDEVRTQVVDVRVQVSAILAMTPHFATKADLHAQESRLIKWIIGTGLASAALATAIASAIAKFLH
jgi:hypothetical protein